MYYDRITGIYKIYSYATKAHYIGQSSNIGHRWQWHKHNLQRNQHHSKLMQLVYYKYGIGDFILSLLEETSYDKLNEREKFYLRKDHGIFNSELPWYHFSKRAPVVDQPYNLYSADYKEGFRRAYRRWPTWRDAMAHCSDEVKSHWTKEFNYLNINLDFEY